MTQSKRILLYTLMIAGICFSAVQARQNELSIEDRAVHRRAMEVVNWSQPLMSFKAMRDAFFTLGGDYRYVGYFSKVQNWKFQVATPNSTTPYVVTFWNLKDGPIVVQIPASSDEVGVFGTLMDSWQRPLEDVGARGKDGGRGGKYLLLPPEYRGPVPMGHIPLHSTTYQGFSILRPIIASAKPENLAKATAFVKGIKLYPLSEAGQPAETKFIDLYDKNYEGITTWDASYFEGLSNILQEEYIEERDLGFWGMAATLDIEKEVPYKADKARSQLLDDAAAEALKYFIHQFHGGLVPPHYDDRQWTGVAAPGIPETGWTYIYPHKIAIDERGATYYGICTSVKNYGSGTFYLFAAKDKEGEWLDGGNTYKLNVLPNVPVRDFWSVEAYDVETAAWIRGVSHTGVDSTKGLQANDDGAVDIYVGPKSPKGKESNWIPTQPGRRFFICFRFYGPEAEVFSQSWKLNDVERLK